MSIASRPFGCDLLAMSKDELVHAVLMLTDQLQRERNGQAFRQRVLARIVPFPRPVPRIAFTGIIVTDNPRASRHESHAVV